MIKFFKNFSFIVGALIVVSALYFLNESEITKIKYIAEKNLSAIGTSQNISIKKTNVSILSFGDAMFGRKVGELIKNNIDPFELLKKEENPIDKFDITTLNLEGPITESVKCQNKAYSFNFASSTGGMLRENKITAANIANNHTFDCYKNGLDDTLNNLDQAGVNYFGWGGVDESYFEKEINGKRVALVGVDLTMNPEFNSDYLNLIKKLKTRDDFVIVNIHWGIEYAKKQSQNQEYVGRKIVDAGANAVIGHHPHVIEPFEIYKNKPIFYSLGNFIFDQIGEEENRGLGVGLTFENASSTLIRLFPYEIKKTQPELMPSEKAEEFCENFIRDYYDYKVGECALKI